MSPEALDSAHLVAGTGLAGDRAMAIARKPGTFDLGAPDRPSKNHFVMLMRDERLAKLDSSWSKSDQTLSFSRSGEKLLSVDVATEVGRTKLERFLKEFLEDPKLDPKLVRCGNYKFTDISRISPAKMNAVSLINLNSVRALEQAVGQVIDPLRFRANFLFDGLPAWEELNWIDKHVAIGDAKAVITMRTQRCAATQVNPKTAERDLDLPKKLRDHFGHSDMGVYAEIDQTGDVCLGSSIGLIED